MTSIKPSDHGIVVDHVETGIRYAISDSNYDVKRHRKVRDLEPHETVYGYKPRPREALGGSEGSGTTSGSPVAASDQADDSSDVS